MKALLWAAWAALLLGGPARAADGAGPPPVETLRASLPAAETPWDHWAVALWWYRQMPRDRGLRHLIVDLGLRTRRVPQVRAVAEGLHEELRLSEEVCEAARAQAASAAEAAVADERCAEARALADSLEAVRIALAQPLPDPHAPPVADWHGAPPALDRLIPRVLAGADGLTTRAERRQHRQDLRWLDAQVAALGE